MRALRQRLRNISNLRGRAPLTWLSAGPLAKGAPRVPRQRMQRNKARELNGALECCAAAGVRFATPVGPSRRPWQGEPGQRHRRTERMRRLGLRS